MVSDAKVGSLIQGRRSCRKKAVSKRTREKGRLSEYDTGNNASGELNCQSTDNDSEKSR